jgi:sugar O-acyltransferase (sialic acid O-acetyltransferase NeuD family)
VTEPELVVYGGGGHGRVVLDAAQAAGARVLGFLDDRLTAGSAVDGLPVLGNAGWLAEHAGLAVALGVGDNAIRERIASEIVRAGSRLATVIHPRAVVAASAKVEAGAVVLAFAVVNPGARVGRGAIVNSGAVVEHDVELGEFSHVSPNATLGGAAQLGRAAHVGLAGCVLPGRSVGAGSTVGAGAVVTRDIGTGVVVVGVPARSVPRKAR